MKNRRLLFTLPRPRHTWRHGLAVMAFAGLLASAGAQTANLYSFSSGTGAILDPMTGATTILGTNQDDGASAVTNIGFTFTYEGTAYTQFSVNSNGAMRLGGSAIQAYNVDNINDPNNNPKIIPFSADGTTGSGGITTVLTGTTPNQTRIIQWNVGVDYGQTTPNCTYQVWLHETSGVIEFKYGTGTPTGGSTYWWTGISGAIGTNYINVRPGYVGSNTVVTRLQAWPGNGTIFTFTPPAPCNTPAPGNTVAVGTAGCSGFSTSLSLQNSTPGSGVSYQWESSPDGSSWSAISGANTATYTTANLITTTWFRCSVTCSTGPSTVASNPVQITISTPAPTYAVYAGVQINENFSSWGNRCSTTDVPSAANNNWINTPAYGPGTWRRNDQGASAGWNNTSGYFYSDANGAVAPAARFHSRQGGSVVGTLDYYINMSAATGSELLRFEYINTGNGTLEVLVSQNGGASFTTRGTLNYLDGAAWSTKEYTIGSTSAQTVIRLKGTAGAPANSNDIGVDNFRIIPAVTCAKPTALAATVTGPGNANVTWTCTSCTGSYIMEYGPTGFTPGTGTTAGVNGTVVTVAASPGSISGVTAGNYDVYVRQNCGGGNGISENSTKATFSIVNGDFCANAINLTALPLTDWSTIANTTGASNNYTSAGCLASLPGGDVVLYRDVEAGATIKFVLQAPANALVVSYGGTCPGSNNLACTTAGGGYLQVGTYVTMVDGYPTFTWTNNGCSTERLYILADAIGAGGVVYIATYAYTPAAGPFCSAVTGVAVNTVNTGAGANVSWNATCSGNVIVEYGLSGFTPGTGATAGVGGTAVAVSGTSTALSGLTLDAAYNVYVRQSCGAGVYSANSVMTAFTLHNGDDCSRVMAMNGISGSVTVNTTGANNDVAFCNAGDTGGDLILSTTVQPGDGIYFTSAPQAPYVGRVAIGAGSTCPGQALLYCNAGAADFFWQNATASPVNVYFVQDGADEGSTTISWQKFTFAKMVVSITTDNNPAQITWEILDDANAQVASGSPATPNSVVNTTVTLPSAVGDDACYGFRIMDSFGDGITNGGWELRTTGGKLILRDNFASGSQSPSATPATPGYGSAHSFCLPLGPADIAANECGIFNNALGNKVYCNKVTGATQYQFEFSDPDAGFYRRITTSTNYVIFSQLNATPLTPGVKYFARVRTNVAGPVASAHFGSGCDMGLGVAQVVTCSELIQAPAYGHSCNETRTFNTNNSFIYAKPVVGGTEYQFRIFNISEGYDQTFTRSTYILQMKWNANVAPGLTVGSTYNVEVNVKVSGVYTGFCPSSCTITIVGNTPGGRPEAMLAEAQGQATLWPNPVRDGQVNLSIDGLADAQQKITVDILDLYGKQVFAQEFGNSGERFTTLLDLPSTVASGVYIVNITVNGKTTVQRLSIIK